MAEERPLSSPLLPVPQTSAPSPASAGLETPESGIGKYRLVAELGHGGMADIFLAMVAGPGGFSKLLVLKQLRVGDDPTLVSMFLDEARLAARVSHPNIVQTFEVVHENSRAFMLMEFLDGPSLSRLRRAAMKRGERVPLKVELKILTDALLGLHYAHELRDYDGTALGVVHRDFTPQNIIVTYAGDVKIVDFGIAKVLDQKTLTSAGIFKGKLTYVPPEQLMAQAVDRRADIFSAGVMLYEAVLGESPWKALTNAAVTHALASGRIPRVMENAHAPPELASICDQAMAVDPDDRFATADELRLALDEFVHEHHLEMDRAQLGVYVDSMMGESREQTRHIIDEQLKLMKSLPRANTLGTSLPTLDALTPPPQGKVVGRSLPSLMSSEATPDTSGDTGAGAAKGSRMAALLGVLALVVIALVGVVVFLVTQDRAGVSTVRAPEPVAPPFEAAPSRAPAPIPPPPPPPEALPATIVVRVRASPANARLYLDDLELPGNPFEGTFARDTHVRELRVAAPGHLELRRGVQFDRDQSLEVMLGRASPPRVIEQPRANKPVEPNKAASKDSTPEASEYEYLPHTSGPKKPPPPRAIETNIEFP
jgi:serine/threonine protein kinase